MTNIHTADFNGKTYTRTSQSRIYTHCVAVVRSARKVTNPNVWPYRDQPEWVGVETWCGSADLARKAADGLASKRQFDGTEGKGRSTGRRYISPKGNGPALYSQVVVLPVTLQTKTPKVHATETDAAKADLAKRKARATRRAANFGVAAASCVREAIRQQGIADNPGPNDGGSPRWVTMARDSEAWAVEHARKAWHLANERLALDLPARDAEGAIVAPTVLDVPAADVCEHEYAQGCRVCNPEGNVQADPGIRPTTWSRSTAAGAAVPARGPATFAVTTDGTTIPGLSVDAAREVASVHRATGGDVTVVQDGGAPVEDTRISCGCCRGPVEDRCCCHIHQDLPRGLQPKTCSRHAAIGEGARP